MQNRKTKSLHVNGSLVYSTCKQFCNYIAHQPVTLFKCIPLLYVISQFQLTDFPSPLPFHFPLTFGTRLVEVTGSTSRLINNGRWLQRQKVTFWTGCNIIFLRALLMIFAKKYSLEGKGLIKTNKMVTYYKLKLMCFISFIFGPGSYYNNFTFYIFPNCQHCYACIMSKTRLLPKCPYLSRSGKQSVINSYIFKTSASTPIYLIELL